MNHADLAKKIREAIFDQAEEDGRVMHGDAMDAVIEKALNAHVPRQPPGYTYGVYLGRGGNAEPQYIEWVIRTESAESR